MSYCPEHGVLMESLDHMDGIEGYVLFYLCPQCPGGHWVYFDGTYSFVEHEKES